MNPNTFIWIVCIILGLQLISIITNISFVLTAKAGDINDYHFRYSIKKYNNKYLNVNGQIVDVSHLLQRNVSGESMKDYNIHNGQTIFEQKLTMQEILNLQDFPILVYRLEQNENTKLLDSKIKLRKFVGLIDLTETANTVYEKYSNRIKIDKECFLDEFNTRQQHLNLNPENKNKKFILSATHSTKLNRYHYSIHAADTVEGIVKYVI